MRQMPIVRWDAPGEMRDDPWPSDHRLVSRIAFVLYYRGMPFETTDDNRILVSESLAADRELMLNVLEWAEDDGWVCAAARRVLGELTDVKVPIECPDFGPEAAPVMQFRWR